MCRRRKAKRPCPAVRGEICPQCCGEARENTVNCPLDCAFLIEAHRLEFDKPLPRVDPAFPQYQVTEDFLYAHDSLIGQMSAAILLSALDQPSPQDSDLTEAIHAAIRTRETQASGLIYESAPALPVPQAIYRGLREFLERAQQETGVKDSEVLLVLVFLARLAQVHANGRPRSKAFLGYLRQRFPQAAARQSPGGIIVAP
jgi:hypothetical protein